MMRAYFLFGIAFLLSGSVPGFSALAQIELAELEEAPDSTTMAMDAPLDSYVLQIADSDRVEEDLFFKEWQAQEAQESPTLRRIDEEDWRDATEKLVYDEKMIPQKEVKQKESSIFPKLFTYLIYAAVLAMVVALFYLLFRKMIPARQSVKVGIGEVDLESIEDLENMDLVTLLQRAQQDQNYREIIRINFLMVMQELAGKGIILWRPEKTNRDYTRELLADQSIQKGFQELAAVFEQTRYGDVWVEQSDVDRLIPRFDLFRNLLDNYKKPAR
jgi:hypothetical protein